MSDLRTGRWTNEETAYCDKLIQKFMAGRLPLPEGIKLNEFLSNMLKSKQSRLTKKMKNAKLSSKTFTRTAGYLTDIMEGREFSECEDAFFHSIQNGLDRAEIKFHMQKEWRETFSNYCVSYGQPLNVDRWLASVEEMERRVHQAKDVERQHRRKIMMGCALKQDSQNPDRGVVIVKNNNGSSGVVAGGGGADGSGVSSQQQQQQQNGSHQTMSGGTSVISAPDSTSSMMGGNNDMVQSSSTAAAAVDTSSQSQNMASPFLHIIMGYIHRNQVPFEYIDAWVPSFVPDTSDDKTQSESESAAGSDAKQSTDEKQPKCRLCFAGSFVAKQVIVCDIAAGQARRAVPMSPDDLFNLSAFGDYSESFSFDVGCGLPGRVYHMGVPTWEQSVHNAPLHHFERVGGSQQWGIRTVVGIPVPSPNVGRVVVVLYSRHDRSKDHDLVIRLTEEFARLMPSPKWKLIVDVGSQVPPAQQPTQNNVQQQQQGGMESQQNNKGSMDPAVLTSEVISIFGEHMPSDQSNPAWQYLQGFMSLRLLLLRPSRSDQEQDIVNTILSSYSSYKAGGRSRPDIALMLARDFLFLQQMSQSQQQQQPLIQQMQQQQPNNNGQQQFMQQQQQQQQQQPQNAMYSPAMSSVENPNSMKMPPPSQHHESTIQQPQDQQQQAQCQQQEAEQFQQEQPDESEAAVDHEASLLLQDMMASPVPAEDGAVQQTEAAA